MTSTMKIENGNQVWRNSEGEYHRADGPAVVHPDGSKQWWVDGLRHRLDGPAEIYADGTQAWWVKGRFVSLYFIKQHIRHNPPTLKEQQFLGFWEPGNS